MCGEHWGVARPSSGGLGSSQGQPGAPGMDLGWLGQARKGSREGQEPTSQYQRQGRSWRRGGSPLLSWSLPEDWLGRGCPWKADLSSGATFTPAGAQLPRSPGVQPGKGDIAALTPCPQPSNGSLSGPLSGWGVGATVCLPHFSWVGLRLASSICLTTPGAIFPCPVLGAKVCVCLSGQTSPTLIKLRCTPQGLAMGMNTHTHTQSHTHRVTHTHTRESHTQSHRHTHRVTHTGETPTPPPQPRL